jgi:hypothetical protein
LSATVKAPLRNFVDRTTRTCPDFVMAVLSSTPSQDDQTKTCQSAYGSP